jgi:hypothetical protein
MDERGRRLKLCHRRLRWTVVVAIGFAGTSGCFRPTAVSQTRLRYNEVVRDTNDEQPLLNIVRLRNVQIATFLSKGVCVPDEHVARGVAPMTPGPLGLPYDWTLITAGHFFEHCQKRRSKDAEAAVPYRGYWFLIASNDVKSRASLATLELSFALQESDGKSVGPLLTLPLGG